MINGLWSIVVVAAYALWMLVAHVFRVFWRAMPLMHMAGKRRHHHHVAGGVRVCVVGGGIAGTAAAWSLKKSNKFEAVKLFESRPVLGGNAKTFVWEARQPSTGAQASVRTGLSVLAWPAAYFKNYSLLLEELHLATVDVVPKFYVSADGATATFRQGADAGNERWASDQRRWDRAVAAIRRVNRMCFVVTGVMKRVAASVGRICHLLPPRPVGAVVQEEVSGGDGVLPSMYEVTLVNPMNLIPARWFCRAVFGVSDAFWDQVVVPIYSSSFLTTELNLLPSVILPALDDIISIGLADPLKVLHTWAGSSKDVFDAMGDAIGPENIALGVEIESVVRRTVHHGKVQWCVRYRQRGASNKHEEQRTAVLEECFDYVVFACPATAVDALTNHDMNRRKRPNQSDGPFRDALFEAIVPNVRYENERDGNFVSGCVHSDRALAIPNEALRKDLIANRFTNYIELHGDPARGDLENTFVLGTWVPTAVAAAKILEASSAASVSAGTSEGDDTAPPSATKRKHPRRGHGKKHNNNATGRHGGGAGDDVHSQDNANTLVAAAQAPATAKSEPPQHRTSTASPNTTVVDGVADMYVTYNATGAKREALHAQQLLSVDNNWAHPQFTMQSMGLSMALPLLQGRHGAYYCASYATPGNGHDLSFLSGLAVAHEVSGGYYPFAATASAAALRDFRLLKGLMFF